MYLYDKVSYVNWKEKVLIGCKIHGYYYQRVDTHLRGAKCKNCSNLIRGNSQFYTLEDFILKANETHNHKYDYSSTEYINSKTKVLIVCKEHGSFLQNPSAHISGKGCPNCGQLTRSKSKTFTTNDFINLSKKIHKNLYDYSLVNYVSSKSKVEIVCKKHGIFKQSLDVHVTQGSGCPSCSREFNGYRKSDFLSKCKKGVGILYLLKLYSNTEEFYKVGITSNSVSRRYSNRSSFPYSYEVVSVIKTKAEKVWGSEKNILKKYKNYKHNPDTHFRGHTECFNTNLPITEILENYFINI